MTELRVGGSVFGPPRKDRKIPKAAVGLALTDVDGRLWALMPKFFFEETNGIIFADKEGSTMFFDISSNKNGVKLPAGGFVAVEVDENAPLNPHAGTPSLEPPEMLDAVDIDAVSSQVSGFSNNFKLHGGEVEPRIILISYDADTEAQPTAGQICGTDGTSFGLVVGVSPSNHLAAVVPWPDLFDRFEKLGLTLAPAQALRQRNRANSARLDSVFEQKVGRLTEWLEQISQTRARTGSAIDRTTRLVSAIRSLSSLAKPVGPPPRLPKGFGDAEVTDWNGLVGRKAIRDIAISVRGRVVSAAKTKPEEIVVTTDQLIVESLELAHEDRGSEVSA